MEFNFKNSLKFLIFLGFGYWLMTLAFKNMDINKMWYEIKNANFIWILLAMLCGVLSHVSRALRWNLLLQPLGYKANKWNAFYSVMIGYFSNNIIPRLGEVIRCTTLAKSDNIPVEKLFGTVLIERVIDLFVAFLVTIFIFISQFDILDAFWKDSIAPRFETNTGNSVNTNYIIAGALVLLGILIYLLRNKIKNLPFYKKIAKFAIGFSEGFKSILKLERPILFIAHSIFIWTMYFAMAYYIFCAYPPTAHLGYQAGLIVLFLGTVSIIVPIPGAGAGIYHILVGSGLLLYGVSENDGITYATISHAAQVIMVFVIGLLSIAIISYKLRKKIMDKRVL